MKTINDIYTHLASRTPAQLAKSRVGLIKGPDSSIESLIAYDSTPQDELLINEADASCLFSISTVNPDRGNDEVLPEGCKKYLASYQANPVVFFSHRSDCYPIASAESPTGQFSVEILPDRIRSRAYFHLKTQESQEVYELLCCKALRGASIGMIPHLAVLVEPPVNKDLPEEVLDFAPMGLRFLEWELFEYSVVPVPMNREALAERMSKGLIKSAALLQTFAPYKHKQKFFNMDPAANGLMFPAASIKHLPPGWESLKGGPFNLSVSQIENLPPARIELLLSARKFIQTKEVAAGKQDPANPLLLDMPDIRQPDHFSCGACSAMCVGKYFGVGPETLEEWKIALGTTVERSTHPQAICDYLTVLGLKVEARENMTLDDLKAAWTKGSPVICPVQDYGPEVPKGAEFEYGHYLTVMGMALEHVFCQDSSAENIEIKDSGTIAEKGRILIKEADWLKSWHDKDVDNKPYINYGIIVSKDFTPAAGSDLIPPAQQGNASDRDKNMDEMLKGMSDKLCALHDEHKAMAAQHDKMYAMHQALTQRHEDLHKKMDDMLAVADSLKAVPAATPPEESKALPEEWDAFLKTVATIEATQKQTSDALFSVTGRR